MIVFISTHTLMNMEYNMVDIIVLGMALVWLFDVMSWL